MSEAKRYRMPRLDDPLSWPRDLRRIGTEIVLASDYDKLEAELTKLRTERDRLRDELIYLRDDLRPQAERVEGMFRYFYERAEAALHPTQQEEEE